MWAAKKNKIIHITGLSGVGKSTLVDKVNKYFGKKVAVDCDDIDDKAIKTGKKTVDVLIKDFLPKYKVFIGIISCGLPIADKKYYLDLNIGEIYKR